MSRWKAIGIPAAVAGVVGVVEYCRKTLETFHILDFMTHLNDSPTLTKIQEHLGTRTGLAMLIATIVVLASAVARLSRRPREVKSEVSRKAEPNSPVTTESRVVSDRKPTRKVLVEEHEEEVLRRRTRRFVVEENDP